MRQKRFGSPNMSDTTLLISVEDLINMAMGPSDVNVVNFKMIQTVLHILARQLRMLETKVEIKISEAPLPKEKKEKKKQPEPPSTDSSSSKSPRKVSPPPKSPLKEIKEEKVKLFRDRDKEREAKAAAKDKEKAEKAALKEKEREGKMSAKDRERAEKEREKAEMADLKDKEKAGKTKDKADRAQSKDRDKAERAETKESDKAERAESKEREKAERAQSKERDKAERAESRDREKADRAASKEREKADRAESREREKGEKTAIKDREKAERAESKEREKADRSAIKDKEKSERAESREREKGEKARDKETRAESRERDKAERAESKERDKAERAESKERDKAERAESKDKEKAERSAQKDKEKMEKMDAKDRERAVREKEKLDKMDAKDRERADRESEKQEKKDAKDRERAEREREKLEKAEAKEREKAERELEKLDKMNAKDMERAEREREKLEKLDAKDREKVERELEKMERMDAKDRERAEREREKLEKIVGKDKERAERDKERAEREKEKAVKAAAKEKEKIEKMSAKEKEKYLKEKAKEETERAKSAKAGISIKERDKVLIVEKGPTTRSDSRTRLGSIEVVTVSQFELLEAAVKDLTEKAGPLPFPALPDNQKLRTELAKGSASLTDTMQAMQVAARVQAAETAIGRMAGLLTQLAAAGALPQDVAGKLEDVRAEMDAISEEGGKHRPTSGVPRKSVAIDPMSKKGSTVKVEAKPSAAAHRPSVTSRASVASKVSIGSPGVTHTELDDALRSLKDDLTKNVNQLTAKATAAAETASATAKSVSDKLDIALKLNTRINSLYSLVTDYAEQLSGFDAGLTTQMQSFQEQMAQMRSDLKGGITLLETANNNAETAAVLELTERYDGLVVELDNTLHAHQALTAFQKQLGDELHSLLECVEMLREQKADRDEVLDGLRDKADNSRLAGLLTESEFASSRLELERRLDLCYDKFRKQEQVWMGAVKDLTEISEGKAEIMQLLAARDDAQQQLRDIQDRLQKLAVILGEPKAAMLTRQISKGARCGACQVPALQEPVDISFGKPPPLPAVRLPPAGEEKPCVPEWKPPQPPDDRDHSCHRWVGGSHTLLAESVVREQAGPMQSLGPPTKRYTGYGTDGRLYMMEEELQPCVECNMIFTETDKIPEDLTPEAAAQADGAGDTGVNQTTLELPK